MKAHLNPETVNEYIDFHKKQSLPFTLTLSNYTSRITSLSHDIHFMRGAQSNRVFGTFAKIKSDIKGKKVKQFSPEELTYFNIKPISDSLFCDTVINIDLKAAYATVLLNDKYISQQTYDHLLKLPKQERLTVVGMLAGKKNIFTIDKRGKIIAHEKRVAETCNYFFHCIERTAQIISKCANAIGDDFIFSWVDGIYISPSLMDHDQRNAVKKVSEILDREKFPFTMQVLTDFEIIEKKRHYFCKWKKDDKNKYMNVPKPGNETAKKIYNFLANKKYL
jgi:hypothetical protein